MQSWMIGSAAALFAVGWLPRLPGMMLCLSFLLFTLGLCALKRRRLTLALLGLACGLVCGQYWGSDLLRQRLPATLEDRVLIVRGRILEPPQLRRYSSGGVRQRFAFEVQDSACTDDRKAACTPFTGKVLMSWYGKQQLAAGERWQFQVRFKRPWGQANPGSFNVQSWLAQRQFAATGSIRSQGAVSLPATISLLDAHQLARQHVIRSLRRDFAGRSELGVLQALSSGDRSAIEPWQWQLFQRFGLNHLVVISGLHVGMVAAIGFWLGGFVGRGAGLRWSWPDSHRCAHISAFITALVYSSLSGFALPTLRALVMLAALQIAALNLRRVQPSRSLLLALLMIALVDPLATHNAGFWLSFSAVALIFLLLYLRPTLRGWRQILALQLLLSPALGLLGSTWFGGSSMVAPLANLVAIPVLSFCLAPLCLLASLLCGVLPGVAQALWSAAAWPVQGFFNVAASLETSGLETWIQIRAGPVQLVFAALGLILLLAPRGWPLRICAPLLFLPLFFVPQRQWPEGVYELTVLDVGQGLSVLVEGRDFALVYDTGTGDPAGPNMAGSVVLPLLQRQGIETLDLLVISHADRDHASGTGTLVEAMGVVELWFGDQPFQLELRQSACEAGTSALWGKVAIQQLHPTAKSPETSSNNRSCVILLDVDGYRVLLPGDIEADLERSLVLYWADQLRASLLIAPHHGSATSSSAPFLRTVKPDHAVFSTGYRNRFGHPQIDVVRRYDAMGIKTFNTATAGAITFRIEAGQLVQIGRWRDIRRFYWH